LFSIAALSGTPTDAVTSLLFIAAIANDRGESVNGILGRFSESGIPPLIRVDERNFMALERDAEGCY
jgi:hypothetical protein